MTHEYAYLVGTIAVGLIWSALLVLRKDLRRAMLWSSWYFFLVMTIGFAAIVVVSHLPSYMTINPGYWDPDTLFDFNRRTGGYGIEDAFFMFFIGGIAAALYEELFGKRMGRTHARHRPHLAVKVGVLAAVVVALMRVNLIYAIVAFGCAGALTIWIQRRDLIWQSVLGGFAFLVVYVSSYLLILLVFPDFVVLHYNLKNMSGILVLGLPVEEYLFALSFGLMWTPIYEYAMDIR